MQKRDPVLILAGIIVAVIIIGQFMIPTVSYNYSSNVVLGEDGVHYSLSADANREFIVSVYEGENHYSEGNVMIYHDESYVSFSDPSEITHIVNALRLDLPLRGVECEVADSKGIRDMMMESISTGLFNTRLVMVSGVLPDTIYGVDGGLILDWLSAGGVLYWLGAPIGLYLSNEDGLVEVDGYSDMFFGMDDAILIPGKTPGYEDARVVYGDVQDGGIAKSLGLVGNDCTFGVNVDHLSNALAVANSTKDGYASIALTKFYNGSGMISIFGGYITYDTVWALSKVIASGLEYDSVLLESKTGLVGPSGVEGVIDFGNVSTGLRIYVCIGVPVEVYGRAYTF